jgi:hypothetical protein
MIGVYDFCGHYEWTFAWLEQQGGAELLHDYWESAICEDSQHHASALIVGKGIDGMKEYWGHTLAEEAAGYRTTATESVFRIDIHDCPSKGFLLRNGLRQYCDYCDHCIGWIGPLMKKADYVIDHEHDHAGHCWWEMRRVSDLSAPGPPGELAGEDDIRLRDDWDRNPAAKDAFRRANGPDGKEQKP